MGVASTVVRTDTGPCKGFEVNVVFIKGLYCCLLLSWTSI